MKYDKQFFPLIIVMTIIVLVVEGLTLSNLYNTSFEKQREQLIVTARSQAALITSVANFDATYSKGDHKEGAYGATLSQVRNAYHNFKGFGKSGELVIATVKDNEIQYLIRSRHKQLPLHKEMPTVMGGDKAVLMQKALSKKSGSIIARDYAGKMTLGAYEYIKPLNYGLVVKIDIDELRAPFIQIGIISLIVAIVLIIIGAFVFRKITNPIIQSLKRSDEYNRMLFETSPIGMALTKMDGTIVDMNSAYALIIGRNKDEINKLKYWDITPKEYADQESKQLENLEATGKYGPYEKEYIHKDGSRIPVSLLGQIIERDGKQYIWSSIENISQRKSAESQLSLNEARLNEAQRMAKVGSWELDLLTGGLVWSDEIFSIFDIDKNKFAASYDAFLEAIHPEDREEVNAAYTNSLETRKPYEIVHRLKMKDGTIKHVRENCKSYFDDENKPIRSVGTVQDITEIVDVEQSLKEFKYTLDQTLDCVFMFDAEYMNFYYVNEGALKQVGYTYNELRKMHPYDIKPEISKEEFHELVAPLIVGKEASINFETVHQHKNGQRINVEIFLQYIAPEDEAARFVAVVRDITERKQTEAELKKYRTHLEELVSDRTRELHETQEELVRKERLATLGQLTATVSHELRNPLGAMRPSIYVIEKKSDKEDERLQNAIGRIDRNIDRCDRIIDELLDFTRITELNMETTRIDEWLESVINEQVIPEGIKIEKDFALKDIELDIDSERLRRAFINVFENACHSMMDDNQQLVKDKNALVNIQTQKNDERVEIRITDVGAGIPEDVLTKIFEPLFSTKGFGVGLGMPTVKQIMEQHHGGIEIESEEGKGTTVILWLPIESSNAL